MYQPKSFLTRAIGVLGATWGCDMERDEFIGQDKPVTGEEELPSAVDLLQEKGLPNDVNEADALDQAYIVDMRDEEERV